MAQEVPTTKLQDSARQTQSQLDQIKGHHDSAETAAEQGAELEAAGDASGAKEAYSRADTENDKANQIADEVQAKVGTNHTVNGDGTITSNKVSGDKFDETDFTQQETIVTETGLTPEQVLLAGPGAADEAMAVVTENKAARDEQVTEELIDDLLVAAGADPDTATDEEVANVLNKEAMRQDGVLDLIKEQGGDPDAMSAAELEDAAVDAVEKEAAHQDGGGGSGSQGSGSSGEDDEPKGPDGSDLPGAPGSEHGEFDGADDALGDGGVGLDRPGVDTDVDTPHLGGGGEGLEDPFGTGLGAGEAPDGSGLGDSLGGQGGKPDAPAGADGLLGRLPDDATSGSGGGGGSGTGQSGGSDGNGPGGAGGGKPGENPLADWNPGSGGGGGGGTAPATGSGDDDAGGGGGGSGAGAGNEQPAGAGGDAAGGGAPSGSGGGAPADDPDGDSGMLKVGNFFYTDVEGQDDGAALDTYVDSAGNVYADGPNGLELVNDEDAGKIDARLKDETGQGVEEYAKAAAIAEAEAEAAAKAEAAAAAAAAEENDDTDDSDEDYAEPPPVASPYGDDPLLNEYAQQAADAKAGADIDYGEDIGGLSEASQTVDVRPGQIDYGGPVASPADPEDIPIEQAQSGLIDPSPMDDPAYGSGGGNDQSEVEAKLKESLASGGGGGESSADSEQAETGYGSGADDPTSQAMSGELAEVREGHLAEPVSTPDEALADLLSADSTDPFDGGIGRGVEPDQEEPVEEPNAGRDRDLVSDEEPSRDAFDLLESG